MNPQALNPCDLLAHSGDKVLLDKIIHFDDESLGAEATIKADSIYRKGDGEPGWMGLEYMSQAVAAFAGIRARKVNMPPKVGMLIGTRRYSTTLRAFPVGMRLAIETRVLLEDENGLSVFQCSLSVDNVVIAEANLNVFQPNDIQHYLEVTKPT